MEFIFIDLWYKNTKQTKQTVLVLVVFDPQKITSWILKWTFLILNFHSWTESMNFFVYKIKKLKFKIHKVKHQSFYKILK